MCNGNELDWSLTRFFVYFPVPITVLAAVFSMEDTAFLLNRCFHCPPPPCFSFPFTPTPPNSQQPKKPANVSKALSLPLPSLISLYWDFGFCFSHNCHYMDSFCQFFFAGLAIGLIFVVVAAHHPGRCHEISIFAVCSFSLF